jgi:hypothetical protein
MGSLKLPTIHSSIHSVHVDASSRLPDGYTFKSLHSSQISVRAVDVSGIHYSHSCVPSISVISSVCVCARVHERERERGRERERQTSSALSQESELQYVVNSHSFELHFFVG